MSPRPLSVEVRAFARTIFFRRGQALIGVIGYSSGRILRPLRLPAGTERWRPFGVEARCRNCPYAPPRGRGIRATMSGIKRGCRSQCATPLAARARHARAGVLPPSRVFLLNHLHLLGEIHVLYALYIQCVNPHCPGKKKPPSGGG